MWVEDACGDRLWVDRPQCKLFVDNIITSFETILPSTSLLAPISDSVPPPSGSSSPLGSAGDDPTGLIEELLQLFDPLKIRIPVFSRYL